MRLKLSMNCLEYIELLRYVSTFEYPAPLCYNLTIIIVLLAI